MDINTFESGLKDKIAMVDFGASWCGPCRKIEPIIEAIKEKYRDRAQVVRVDINTQPSLASNYMVQSIPTLIFFDHGHEVTRLIGLQSEQIIDEKMNALLTGTLH